MLSARVKKHALRGLLSDVPWLATAVNGGVRTNFPCMIGSRKHTLAAQYNGIDANSTRNRPVPIPRSGSAGLRRRRHHRCEGGKLNYEKCRNHGISAMASSARPMRTTQGPWRRSDRAFRSRDLDFHRTVTGRLRRHRRGDFEGTVGGDDVERPGYRAGYPSYLSIQCTWGRWTGRRRL